MAETKPDRGASLDRQHPNHEKLADDLEQQADDLERHSDELQQRTEEASQDWQRKRRDQNVPGAPPPSEDEDGESSTDTPPAQGEDD